MAKDNLWRRGDQYWLYVTVPPPLRRFFLSSNGRPMRQIREPLGDSKTVAKLRASQRAVACNRVFARLRAGEEMTPEQVRAALRDEFAPDPGEEFRIDASTDWSNFDPRPAAQRALLRMAKWFEDFGDAKVPLPGAADMIDVTPAAGEAVSQAAEAWYLELARNNPRPQTVDGHKRRVQAFVKQCGNVPLTDVTRDKASDFLRGLDVANGTRNAYATTLKCVFDDARKRGRFAGDNPFADMKVKKGGDSYVPFTAPELQTLFDNLPRTIAPARHSPETALPWVAAIALYTGARLEEICQLTTADVREEAANGATVWVIDVHNGGQNKLKNESAARLIPVHSALVRMGFLDYVRALPAGPLFPGLKRRESKGGKVGARVGELFRKKLVALGIKRDRLTFHSFRHNVSGCLDAADVRQSDAARILGHAVAGMSYGTYSQAGPGLKRVAAVIEQITYEGLRLSGEGLPGRARSS
jgi:integrase